jgi:hypothetical protein
MELDLCFSRPKKEFVDVDSSDYADVIPEPSYDPDVACEVTIETRGEDFLPFEPPVLGVQQERAPVKSCLSAAKPSGDASHVKHGPLNNAQNGKRRIGFDEVKVFYFNRSQGTNVVPSSEDGCTLALDRRHSDYCRLPFADYCVMVSEKEDLVGPQFIFFFLKHTRFYYQNHF